MKPLHFFLIGMLCIVAVHANQPSLPTAVYGQVLNSDNKPATSVSVTAHFEDGLGEQRSVSTQTLSYGQESGGAKAGYYYFNKGFIAAKAGSTIRIEVEDATQIIPANPGGAPIKATTISLSTGGGQTVGGSSGGSGSGSGTGSGSGSGTGSGTGSGSGSGSGTGSGTSTGGTGTGSAASGSNGDGTGSGSGESSGNSDGGDYDGGGTDGSGSGSGIDVDGVSSVDAPPTPWTGEGNPISDDEILSKGSTTLYGQLLDASGEPVGGKQVKATFLDSSGATKSITATTLTKEEAEALGNSSLEGYFKFNKGDIDAQSDSSISVAAGDVEQSIRAQPGERLFMTTYSGNPKIVTKKRKLNSTHVVKAVGAQIKNNAKFIVSIGIVVAALLFVHYRRKIKFGMQKILHDYSATDLYLHVKRLEKRPVEKFMTKYVMCLDGKKSLTSAMQMILNEDIGALVVQDMKKPKGIITERDILRRIDLNSTSTKIKDIMSTPLKWIPPTSSLWDAIQFSLKNNVRKIPVMKKGKLLGIVTQTDLVKEFDTFIEEFEFDSDNLPQVRDAMTNTFIDAKSDETLDVILAKMKKENVFAVVIGSHDTTVPTLLTERGMIAEIFKNPKNIGKISIGKVLNQRVKTVLPSTNIFTVNKIMIANKVRYIPVYAQNQILGIITQTDLLKQISEFLAYLYSKHGRI